MRRHSLSCARFLLAGVLSVAALAGGGWPLHATALEATPEAQASNVACDVPRRSVAEILAPMPLPPGEGTPWPGRMIGPLPTGSPADEKTIAEISRTVRLLEACANAGDFLRFLSLMSDDMHGHTFVRDGLEAELKAMEDATPSPVPAGQQFRFTGPWHIQELDDGRVMAAVIWFGSEADTCIDPNRIDVVVFVQQDGRWLVDDRIEDVDMGDPIDVVGIPPASVMDPPLKLCFDAEPSLAAPDNWATASRSNELDNSEEGGRNRT